ncbi:MAG: ABC transporter permease [Acidobacteriota bacterium]|nr:ABC transporter permease [Acidobacteriota bacterium]
MRFADSVEFSLASLGKRKLRTFLTTFGVTIGIGAFVSMISFGSGMQKNVTESFKSLELFNSIMVFPDSPAGPGRDPDEPRSRPPREKDRPGAVLDDNALAEISRLDGVETAYPDINFPALIRLGDREEFRLIQVVPSKIVQSWMFRPAAGKPFATDDEDSVIISRSFLRGFDIRDPARALGRKLEISSLFLDFGRLKAPDGGGRLDFRGLPLSFEKYELTITGVSQGTEFGGPNPVQSAVVMPPGAARKIKRLPFSSIWDVFRMTQGRPGYSAVNVRLVSPKSVDAVKSRIREMGFSTFALADQFEQLKAGFLYLDMILAAVGMIAIFVAALGIINTMVMSILERYREIGIMKAVGASDRDIRNVFFIESGVIGFLGGLFGFALGWAVSRGINQIVNYFLAKQGVPFVQYFSFPWWIFAGSLLFSVTVSLVSGIYPAHRAARVDPVIALRHD